MTKLGGMDAQEVKHVCVHARTRAHTHTHTHTHVRYLPLKGVGVCGGRLGFLL